MVSVLVRVVMAGILCHVSKLNGENSKIRIGVEWGFTVTSECFDDV